MNSVQISNFNKIKSVLIMIRIILTVISSNNIVVEQRQFFEELAHHPDQNPEENLSKLKNVVLVVAIILQIFFTALFVGFILRNWFGGILVMTTLSFVTFLIDFIYEFDMIDKMSMQVLELIMAFVVVLLGYICAFMLSIELDHSVIQDCQADNDVL